MTNTPIVIIEDSQADCEAIVRALAGMNLTNPIYQFSWGEDAHDLLRGRGRFFERSEDAPPQLVLLDLNLPGRGGMDLLRAVRADAALRFTPVVVFSTSSNSKEIAEAYASGANAYVTKPAAPADFARAVRAVAEFWLRIATLPSPGGAELRDSPAPPRPLPGMDAAPAEGLST